MLLPGEAQRVCVIPQLEPSLQIQMMPILGTRLREIPQDMDNSSLKQRDQALGVSLDAAAVR